MEKYLTDGFSSIWRWMSEVTSFEEQENLVERYDSEKYKYLQNNLDKSLIRMRTLVNQSEKVASEVQTLLNQINTERLVRRNVNNSALRNKENNLLAIDEYNALRRSAKEQYSTNSSFKSTKKGRGKYE